MDYLPHPYPFTEHDLGIDRLVPGAMLTLTHFRQWRDAHPEAVARHIDLMTGHLAAVAGPSGRWFRRGKRRQAHTVREIVYFTVFNMAEVPAPEDVKAIAERIHSPAARGMRDRLAGVDLTGGATGIAESLTQRLPVLRDVSGIRWLAERLDRLYRSLPEAVVAAGGMGKVVRTMMGVLLIGAYDTRHATKTVAREHLERILPAAYGYGAAYAIVDDTLHDMPGDYMTEADRQSCHDLILRGLRGDPATVLIDPIEIPDHPLAEEAHDVYRQVTQLYPRRDFAHLYHAAESMYQAQHEDSAATTEVYRFIKAGMSRVVANILGRRTLDDGFYARCINTIAASQWRDDLLDHEDDIEAGRSTPFTGEPGESNPLLDLFAYNAYVADEVFGGDASATDALTYRAAGALGRYLAAKPARAPALARHYRTTPEMAAFLRTASSMSRRAVGLVDFADQQVKRYAGEVLGRRDQNSVDVRTFVADRMGTINDLLRQHLPRTGGAELDEVISYAIAAPGKRLRPALSLMLAEGLGVDPQPLGPALAASEFLHTASLLFDDLPAQDNATLRRGRPAAHRAFDEATVQLAALSMIFASFGLVAGLDDRFPPHKVTEVLAYLGAFAGPQLCRGQSADLRLGRHTTPVTAHAIVTMYSQKTSTAIEAALIPIMILHDRDDAEIALVRRYAHHAGIVFQIQDDFLDSTSLPNILGKDTGIDAGRTNLIRDFGSAAARHVLDHHLLKAIESCRQLPFDTRLLQSAVRYFATRIR